MVEEDRSSRQGLGSSFPLGLRELLVEDRAEIVDILERVSVFKPHEVKVALELIDEYLARGEESGYCCLVARAHDRPAGYVCFGPTPMADSVFDLYWIVADPRPGPCGIGSFLLQAVERLVVARGARMMVIETASNPLYRKTISFYRKHGYREEGRVPDFYANSDDKIILVKRFSNRRDC